MENFFNRIDPELVIVTLLIVLLFFLIGIMYLLNPEYNGQIDQIFDSSIKILIGFFVGRNINRDIRKNMKDDV